jgi:hypothetical protein
VLKNESLLPVQAVRQWAELFSAQPDGFWQSHYLFGEGSRRIIGGLGRGRVHEIMINALLPVLLLYARVFSDTTARSRALEILRVIPRGHAVPEAAAVERALGRSVRRRDGAYLTQGAIHLFRLYCAPRRCAECEIGRAISVPPPMGT